MVSPLPISYKLSFHTIVTLGMLVNKVLLGYSKNDYGNVKRKTTL
jgi:hypothetical protein